MYRDSRQHQPVPWRWPDLLKALAAAVVVFFASAILLQLGRAPLRALQHYLMRQGLSPHVYLLTRRMERAAALLRNTDRPRRRFRRNTRGAALRRRLGVL